MRRSIGVYSTHRTKMIAPSSYSLYLLVLIIKASTCRVHSKDPVYQDDILMHELIEILFRLPTNESAQTHLFGLLPTEIPTRLVKCVFSSHKHFSCRRAVFHSHCFRDILVLSKEFSEHLLAFTQYVQFHIQHHRDTMNNSYKRRRNASLGTRMRCSSDANSTTCSDRLNARLDLPNVSVVAGIFSS